jgi:hypothetical protein
MDQVDDDRDRQREPQQVDHQTHFSDLREEN